MTVKTDFNVYQMHSRGTEVKEAQVQIEEEAEEDVKAFMVSDRR